MEKTEQTLWAVYTNDDLTEGRGRQYVKHFCKLQATAIRLAKRGYVQGSDCPVSEVKALVLDGQHVLPTSLIKVEQPTHEDEVLEARLVARSEAIQRAKDAGLSDADIKLLAHST
jgi:hypothetical protein